ncbi:MAG: HAD family hydrolase [Nitrospirae bacterium]|nr:HAD family hydrolase [Nitrospirota bacterium]
MSPVQASEVSTCARVRVGAFFDVDNTLIPGSAIEVRFFRYLWRHRLVGLSEAVSSLRVLLQHLPPVSLQPLRERKPYLVGKQASLIESQAEEFIRAEVLPRLSPDGLAAMEAHRRAGHHLVLLTGSLDFLVAPLARDLGIKSVLAARPERTGEGYTGRLLPPLPYGEGKRRLVESFAIQQGLDLLYSYAYGDSPGDVELLQAVGHPMVVNPIRGMARTASHQGWPVVKWE